MSGLEQPNEAQANLLCKACGLCCSGHLFIWAKLRPAELDPAEALGMRVFRSDPNQRGFSQPCPLWKGQCGIYASPHYPHVCRAYRCKLLKDVLGEHITLSAALGLIGQAKAMIDEVEALLPASANNNFRERLVAWIEDPAQKTPEFQHQADALRVFYAQIFGVHDLLEKPAGIPAEKE